MRVDSAGTHSWEFGNPTDPRNLAMLRRHGHDHHGGRHHVARQFERAWFDEVDLVLAAMPATCASLQGGLGPVSSATSCA